MCKYVLMFTETQYVSISFHIHWNSICIDTFSYTREFNIIIRLTFIAIEHVSVFFHIQWNSVCIDTFLCRKSVHIDTFSCLQKF
jgi:hypothetical protein